jgi:hypothetical protein
MNSSTVLPTAADIRALVPGDQVRMSTNPERWEKFEGLFDLSTPDDPDCFRIITDVGSHHIKRQVLEIKKYQENHTEG